MGTPTFATKVMRDVAARLKETHMKEYDDSFSCAQTPLMKSIDVSNHEYDEKSFYTDNIKSSGEANLVNLREDAKSKNKIETNKEFILDPTHSDMSSDDKKITDVTPKLSAKQRKKLKKEAKLLAKTLEPLASVKEENEEEEVLVKTEEPSVEAFPPLYHPSDTSVVSFPGPSNTTREWL